MRFKKKKKNKYNAKPKIIDGHKFPSIKEADRYQELKLLKKAGQIKELELQPRFEIIPKFNYRGKDFIRAVYTADFKYYEVETNEWVIEEVKGVKTRDYILRKKLFLLKYGDKYKFIEL